MTSGFTLEANLDEDYRWSTAIELNTLTLITDTR